MTTPPLLRQLRQLRSDLRYREQAALPWTTQEEQTKREGLGALAVIQAQLAELTHLGQQVECEGRTAGRLTPLD
jgi:hypothetical protein